MRDGHGPLFLEPEATVRDLRCPSEQGDEFERDPNSRTEKILSTAARAAILEDEPVGDATRSASGAGC
jgi:hypothetical protein